MDRNELEAKITEAVDGMLTRHEILALEHQLKGHPDLLEAWQLISVGTRLKEAFPLEPADPVAISRIRAEAQDDLSGTIISMFPGYMLAAATVIFMLTGIFQYMNQKHAVPDAQLFEWIHAADHELVFMEVAPVVYPEINNGGNP